MSYPRRPLWRFALLALLFHLLLIVAITVEKKPDPPEPPLSGKFVKRRPLRQRVLQRSMRLPHPVRPLRRSVVAPQAFARSIVARAPQPSVPQWLTRHQIIPTRVRPSVVLGRGISSRGRLRSAPVTVEVQATDRLDLGLELLDVEALDTGQYRALVIVDPTDKRKLKGFVHLSAVALPSALQGAKEMDPEEVGIRAADQGGLIMPDWRHAADVQALVGLARELETQTGVKAAVDEDVELGAPSWMSSPFILLTSMVEFVPSEAEVQNLGRYLTSGGFAFVEVTGFRDHDHSGYGWVTDLYSLRQLIVQALESQGVYQGRDWTFEQLEIDHPLFHCFFDLKSLPVSYWAVVGGLIGNIVLNYQQHAASGRFTWDALRPPFLEGVHLHGRLVAVYSQQSYRDFWSRRIERSLSGTRIGANLSAKIGNRFVSEAALRLGVNLVVYALTQEGSLARRYVNTR